MPLDDAIASEKGRRSRIRQLTDRFYDMKRRMRVRAAAAWRRQFRKTTFIGVTGSHGKSTATVLLAAILQATAPTRLRTLQNQTKIIARTVLRTLPWRYRYFVQEVAAEAPMVIDASLDVLRPSVGVVTAIGGDHRTAYGGSMVATAAEKAKLVHRLPADGLAVLNADDPRVAAMAAGCRCRVVCFGRSKTADLRLLDATAAWPGRLEFDVLYRGESFRVKTRLVGAHWTVSVMAALLSALELGIDRSMCLRTIEAFEPVPNRLSVHPGPHGAWYVLDAIKASFFGIETCLEFLDLADAPRKTVIFGTISDYPGSSRGHYHQVARIALRRADRVFFTGPQAQRARRLAVGEFAGRLFIVDRPADVLKTLSEDAIAGEIIYVKASMRDRLGRVFVPDPERRQV